MHGLQYFRILKVKRVKLETGNNQLLWGVFIFLAYLNLYCVFVFVPIDTS